MAKLNFVPIVTEEDNWRAEKAKADKKFWGDTVQTPRKTGAEIEIARLKAELVSRNAEVGELKWQLTTANRANLQLQDEARALRNELRYERNKQSSVPATIDLGLWRRILKLVHPDYHAGNADAVEVTRLVILMKPNR